MNKEEKVFSNTVINWLVCIYAVHHLSPYKMVISKKWDLANFNKKERKIIKNRLKIDKRGELLWI